MTQVNIQIGQGKVSDLLYVMFSYLPFVVG